MRVLLLLLLGCATERAELEDPACCREKEAASESRGLDFAEQVEGPARCAAAAEALLPANEAWQRLWACVNQGHFTALRELTSGAWDHELRSRPDAPMLILHVIAARGGVVDEDLARLHQRRVPLFSLSQAMAQPGLYRGALVIARARLSPHGVLDETRVVSRSADAPLGTTTLIQTPYGPESHELRARRWYNLDVPTGQRALAVLDGDPFLDAGPPMIVLARFDGLREGDGWPQLSLLSHVEPAATLSY
jgi:hypothetical protein